MAYIGSSQHYPNRFSAHKSRLRKGKHENQALQKDWNFLGEESFAFILLEDVSRAGLLHAVEQLWMGEFSKKYNSAPNAGNNFGLAHSEASRRNMVVGARKRPKPVFTDLHKARIAEAAKGRRHTEETKEKIRQANLERWRLHKCVSQ